MMGVEWLEAFSSYIIGKMSSLLAYQSTLLLLVDITLHALWRAWDRHHGMISRFQGLNGTLDIKFLAKWDTVQLPSSLFCSIYWLLIILAKSAKTSILKSANPLLSFEYMHNKGLWSHFNNGKWVFHVKLRTWLGHEVGHWYQNQRKFYGTLISKKLGCPMLTRMRVSFYRISIIEWPAMLQTTSMRMNSN